MIPGAQRTLSFRLIKNGHQEKYWTIEICSILVLALFASRANSLSEFGLNFTLASDDGSYYPFLDVLLQNPKYSYIVGGTQELQALPEYNATTRSFLIDGRKVVVGESFFSVYSAAQVPLWESSNGTAFVPTYFDVRNDAELLLVGFNLNWGALPIGGRTVKPPISAVSSYPLVLALLARLQLYVELSGTGKLQLLHTVITDIPCDGLLRLFEGFGLISNRSDFLSNLAGNVKPSYRLVYPYLFFKYARVGPIWVEDLTISCAANADLSPSACPQRPPTRVNVSSHDELVTALLALETVHVRSCEQHTTVLRLLRHVTLDVARWPRGGGLYLTSNVTFECDPGELLVLDFAGGLNLFKLRAAAFVQLHNLVVTNLAMAPVGVFTVPIWAFNFERDLRVVGEGRLHMVNTTGVIASDEFTHLSYWTGIINNPLQTVAALAAWQQLIGNMTNSSVSNDTLRFSQITGMGVTCVNIAITMRLYSGVRLLLPLTGVAQLLGNDFRSGPPYTVAIYSAAQLRRMFAMPDWRLTRLAEADGLTNGNTTAVLLLLQRNITLDPALWPAPLPVRRRVMVQGKPYSGVELDFGGGTGMLAVPAGSSGSGGSGVEFRYLTLRRAGWLANYTAATAMQRLPPQSFLQTGMWVVNFERTVVPRVSLQNVRLRVSRQEVDLLLTCHELYGTGYGRNASSALGLSAEICAQLMPTSASLSNESHEAGSFLAASWAHSGFWGTDLVLEADDDVPRPDLPLLVQGAYPSSAYSDAAAGGGGTAGTTRVGAIVGGAVGAVAGFGLLAAAVALLYGARRSRTRRQAYQEAALRGLQAKQANQLEELSKRNPLAQLLLDHMAGREPAAAAKLVLATNAATAVGNAAGRTACTGPAASIEAVAGLTASNSSGGGCGLGADEEPPAAAAAATAATATAAAAVMGTSAASVAEAASAPVNINAVDLAELFRHLTILGLANQSGTVAGGSGAADVIDSRGSRGSRSGSKAAAGSSGGGGGSLAQGGGGAPQPLSGLLALSHVVLQRLSRRSKPSRGVQSRERERVSRGRRSGSGSGGGGGGGGGKSDGSPQQQQGSSVSSSGTVVALTAAAGAVAAGKADSGSAVVAAQGMAGRCAAAAAAGSAAATAAVGGGDVEEAVRTRGASNGGNGAAAGAAPAAAASNAAAAAPLPRQLHEQVVQSPVLEELLRLSLDLAGEIDDNQLMVTDVVASGGFGTVYRGMWHNLPVAVKIVLFSTASVNRRIALQEAALSKSISHPNIIATYAVDAKPMAVLGGRSSGNGAGGGGGGDRTAGKSRSLAEIQEWRLYIIQEFADGGTLRRALDSGAFHDPHLGLPRMDMILDIAQGVAAALAHLHSKNIVHGDLNPKNVLLKVVPLSGSAASLPSGRPAATNGSSGVMPAKAAAMATAMAAASGSSGAGGSRGGSGGGSASSAAAAATAAAAQYGTYPLVGRCGFAIKVADFGLSVKMENSHISGLRQGTPFYAAPELSQLGIFSRAADTYAFGVLLWELYWGRPIWVPDARAPGGYVQHADFPLLPPDCPHEYVALVAECLQLNHLQRPGFEEIVARLRLLVQSVRYIFATSSANLGLASVDCGGARLAESGLHPTPGQQPLRQQKQLLQLLNAHRQAVQQQHHHHLQQHPSPWQGDNVQGQGQRCAVALPGLGRGEANGGGGAAALAAATTAAAVAAAGGGGGAGALQHQKPHGARVRPAATMALAGTAQQLAHPAPPAFTAPGAAAVAPPRHMFMEQSGWAGAPVCNAVDGKAAAVAAFAAAVAAAVSPPAPAAAAAARLEAEPPAAAARPSGCHSGAGAFTVEMLGQEPRMDAEDPDPCTPLGAEGAVAAGSRGEVGLPGIVKKAAPAAAAPAGGSSRGASGGDGSSGAAANGMSGYGLIPSSSSPPLHSRSRSRSATAVAQDKELAPRLGSGTNITVSAAAGIGSEVSETERPGSRSSASSSPLSISVQPRCGIDGGGDGCEGDDGADAEGSVLQVQLLTTSLAVRGTAAAAVGAAAAAALGTTATAAAPPPAGMGRIGGGGGGGLPAAAGGGGFGALLDARSLGLEAIREEPEDAEDGPILRV